MSGLARMPIGDALVRGEICFLLDGVNQMRFADRPKRIERWAQWARKLPAGNWAVFTCRTADYQDKLGLPEVRVQSLDTERMKQYFQQRFGARADEHWREFEKRLRARRPV